MPRALRLLGTLLVGSAHARYHYPSNDTVLDCISFFSAHDEKLSEQELQHQFADDGELTLFRTAQKYLAGANAHGTYLDVGCGTGRIISTFGGLFERVTCLEADPKRITTAYRYWHGFPPKDVKPAQWGITRSIDFQNKRFGLEYNGADASYDAISCIQVIQHIPESIVRTWFKKMYALLKADGVLVIATKQRARTFATSSSCRSTAATATSASKAGVLARKLTTRPHAGRDLHLRAHGQAIQVASGIR